jgi:prepilin-type N-terminal cleavage/methylation domain-containing protein
MLPSAENTLRFGSGRRCRSPQRRGFTLFELLLVLAIFLILIALATPALLRSFSAQTLKSGADLVRSNFDKARVHSIRSGNVYAFLYRPGSDEFALAPLINAYSLVRPDLPSTGSPDSQQRLPNGLTFAGGATSNDARAQFESEGGSFEQPGMIPILFYPDGTSQDAQLIVANAQGDQMKIRLRGLTGLSSAARGGLERWTR